MTTTFTLPRPPVGLFNPVAGNTAAQQVSASAAGAPIPIVYGRVRLGANVFAIALLGSDLVIGCGWGLGEIDAVESILINGEAAPGSVTITHYTGLTSQTADATLASAISGYADTLVITAFGVAVGIAYSVLRIPVASISGWPRVEAIVRGKKLYDPRTSTTGYSTNPSLALRDFLISPVYGMGLTVDEASVQTAANANDELLSGGTKRREINLAINTVGQTTKHVEALRVYAGCIIAREGASARLIPDRPASVSRALAAADVGAKSLRLSRRSIFTAPTIVRVKYTNTTTDPWREAEAVAKAAGVDAGTTPRREEIVQLPGITNYAQAYREAVERLNAATLTNLDAEWAAFDESLASQSGDVISLTHPVGLTAKQFRILSCDPTGLGRWRISVTEYNAAVYSDSITSETVDDSTIPTPSAIAPPVLDTPQSGTAHLLKLGGVTLSRMLITYPVSTDPYYLYTEVDYKKSTDANYTPLSPSVGAVYASPVEDGAVYQIRARNVNSYGVKSTYASTSHTIVGKTEPPPPPTSFLISRDSDGTRRFTWNAPSPLPLDLEGYVLRYSLGSGGTWSTMTPLHNGVVVSSPYESNQLAAGTYTFAIAAQDEIKLLSTPVYIETTIGDPRLAGALEDIAAHLDGWPGTKTNCWIDTITGWLVATDSKTWADLSTKTWATWTTWPQTSNTMVYTYQTIDVGILTKFTPLIAIVYLGTAVIEVRTSTDDITYTAWAVPSGQVTARYIQVRVTVSGNGAALKTESIVLDASPTIEDIEDLDTASLTGSYRIAVGDIRLPITKTYGLIKKIDVTLQSVGAGWTYTVMDKNTSPGPRIRIYNGSGVLADAVVDATVKGVT